MYFGLFSSGCIAVETAKNRASDRKKFRRLVFEKSKTKGVFLTLTYILSIYLTGVIVFQFLTAHNPVFACVLSIFSLFLIARQMRALENVVHFGSHYNFSKHKKLNDFLTNVLAAWPMMQDVRHYRVFHNAHHSHYGTHVDPCLERLRKIGEADTEINTSWDLALVIARRMPSYIREYYSETGACSNQIAKTTVWHATSIFLPITVNYGELRITVTV